MTAAYLVKGGDPSLVADAGRRLVDRLVGDDDHGLLVETFDAEEDGALARTVDACLTPPFLAERRIVVTRSAGAWSGDDAGRIVAYLADPLDTTTLVLLGGGGTLSPKLSKAVKGAGGEVIDAEPPRPERARTSWLTTQLKDAPVSFDAAAGRMLGEHLGEDLGRLPGMLNTLVGAYGDGAKISPEELEPFLGAAGGVAPWDLTDAVDRGDDGAALVALHRMMGGGDRHPLVVMATLHRHYANMARLDGSGVRTEQEAAQALGLKGSTFPAKKALAQARRMGSSKLRNALILLAEADLDLRGNKEWPGELVMEILVARLCRLARVR
ncbi:MAG: DNA polymerase III subunit delta [Acidimicrobiales bacterium]